MPGPSPAWHQQHQSGTSRGGFHPNWAEVAPKQPRQEQRSRRRPRGLAAASPPEATTGLATGKGHSAPWNAAPGSGKSCSGSGEGTGTGNCSARNAGTPRRAREEPGDVLSSGDSSALRPRLPLRLLWPRTAPGTGHGGTGQRPAPPGPSLHVRSSRAGKTGNGMEGDLSLSLPRGTREELNARTPNSIGIVPGNTRTP